MKKPVLIAVSAALAGLGLSRFYLTRLEAEVSGGPKVQFGSLIEVQPNYDAKSGRIELQLHADISELQSDGGYRCTRATQPWTLSCRRRDFTMGKRCVTHISEVCGTDPQCAFLLKDLFLRIDRERKPDGTAVTELVHAGVIPSCPEAIKSIGRDLPAAVYLAARGAPSQGAV